MCRWLAYSGSPVLMEDLLYKPAHSLVDQSLHARLSGETTNGDGFGVGWYGTGDGPGVYHCVEPAWNERNLRDLAAHTISPLVFAHIRASTGAPVQKTNCHPFRFGDWLWMHNGSIRSFDQVKRPLVLAVDPSLYPFIDGSTDSETLFYLALSFGLEDDPPTAVARAIGLVEAVGSAHGVANPMQATIATTNGEQMWVFRYSSEHDSVSLFFSTRVETLRALYPGNPLFETVDPATRLVVSEPLGDLPGAWQTVPESSYGIVGGGEDSLHPFSPVSPETSVYAVR
jgi:predicted glutamine amidotransferase